MQGLEYPRFRWVVLAMLLLGTIAQSVIMIAPAPLMESIAKTLGIGVGSATGSIMGTFALAVAVTTVIGGVLNDRFGLKAMFLVSNVLLIIPTILIPVYGQSLQALVVLRILQACGAGPISASMSQVAALWFPPQQRGMVTGMSGLGISLGIAIAMGAAPATFAASGSWQSTLAWMSVSAVISLVAAVVVACGPKPPVVTTMGDVSKASGDSIFKQACQQPVTWIGVVVLFFSSWILNVTNNLWPSYFAIQLPMGIGLGPILAGQLMMMQSIAFMVGSACTGIILQIFKGAANRSIATAYLMVAIFSISVIWPSIFSNTVALSLCLILGGFFQGLVIPAAMAFIAMHYPPFIIGRVTGMWMGLGFLGGTVGIFTSAYTLEATGSFIVPTIIIGLAAVIGFIASLFLNPPKAFSGVGESNFKA